MYQVPFRFRPASNFDLLYGGIIIVSRADHVYIFASLVCDGLSHVFPATTHSNASQSQPTGPFGKRQTLCILHGSSSCTMTPPRPFYIISSVVMLLTKAAVVVYMFSAGDFEFLSWKNNQEYVRTQRVSCSSDNVFSMQIDVCC